MEKFIDLQNWKRKQHFDFFSKYDEPFWGVVSEIDCTNALEKAKILNESFFIYYLHKSTVAINEIEEFRYRIIDDKVANYDVIHAASTIGRKDESFGYSFIKYDKDFNIFTQFAKEEILRVNSSSGLSLNENSERLDVIHYSTLPWTKFTGLTHARNFKKIDSIPKIVFGKYFSNNNRKMMNISINAHHGLADGIHAAKYFELMQKLMDE